MKSKIVFKPIVKTVTALALVVAMTQASVSQAGLVLGAPTAIAGLGLRVVGGALLAVPMAASAGKKDVPVEPSRGERKPTRGGGSDRGDSVTDPRSNPEEGYGSRLDEGTWGHSGGATGDEQGQIGYLRQASGSSKAVPSHILLAKGSKTPVEPTRGERQAPVGGGSDLGGSVQGERTTPTDGYGPRLDEGRGGIGDYGNGSEAPGNIGYLKQAQRAALAAAVTTAQAVQKVKKSYNNLSTTSKVAVIGGTLVLNSQESFEARDVAAETEALSQLGSISSQEAATITQELKGLVGQNEALDISSQFIVEIVKEAKGSQSEAIDLLSQRLQVSKVTAEYVLRLVGAI